MLKGNFLFFLPFSIFSILNIATGLNATQLLFLKPTSIHVYKIHQYDKIH